MAKNKTETGRAVFPLRLNPGVIVEIDKVAAEIQVKRSTVAQLALMQGLPLLMKQLGRKSAKAAQP